MDLEPFVEQVTEQLSVAAALGDERTQQVASALAAAARASVRLAILDALGAAGVEIGNALLAAAPDRPAPIVAVHLDGDQARFSVAATAPAAPEPTPSRPDDGEASARISLRLGETLKSEIERAAAASDVSVNTWLVRAAALALQARPGSSAGSKSGGHRLSGWVTG